MKRKINGVLMILSVVFVVGGLPAWGQDNKGNLAEADAGFSYAGKPINPKLVQKFSSWESDKSMPKVISVDVAAAFGTNEYSDRSRRKGANVCFDTKDSNGMEDGGFFCYEWLGRLKNGLHVLKISDNGGGSGIFQELFFVKFDKGEGYLEDGEKYERLLMSIVRQYTLGDRADAKIDVSDDRVVIGKTRYQDQDVVLTFQPEGQP